MGKLLRHHLHDAWLMLHACDVRIWQPACTKQHCTQSPAASEFWPLACLTSPSQHCYFTVQAQEACGRQGAYISWLHHEHAVVIQDLVLLDTMTVSPSIAELYSLGCVCEAHLELVVPSDVGCEECCACERECRGRHWSCDPPCPQHPLGHHQGPCCHLPASLRPAHTCTDMQPKAGSTNHHDSRSHSMVPCGELPQAEFCKLLSGCLETNGMLLEHGLQKPYHMQAAEECNSDDKKSLMYSARVIDRILYDQTGFESGCQHMPATFRHSWCMLRRASSSCAPAASKCRTAYTSCTARPAACGSE